MKRRVVITGLGVIAPNGIGKDAFWDALKKGKSGIKKVTRFDVSSYPTKIAGEVTDFDPTEYMNPKSARRIDRFSQFGVACAKMAINDAKIEIEREDKDRIGVAVGSAAGALPLAEEQHSIFLEKGLNRVSPLFSTMLFTGNCGNQICIELGIKGYSTSISVACATGIDNIDYAFKMISYNKSDIMIAGASEAPLAPLTFGSFCLIKASSTSNDEPEKALKPFDKYRDGTVLSEGAGILILEELQHALDRGASIYSEIVGYGTAHDAYHLTQPLPNGEQGAKAIYLGLKDAGIKPTDIDYINAHGTSTPLNDKIETRTIKNAFGKYAYKVPVSSIKSMTGHALGGSGAIEAVSCNLVIENQFLPPTINYKYPDSECDLDYIPNVGRKADVNILLLNSSAFGGKNSVLIMRKFNS
ncbi:MAG: beta-ketoacyl-ACP synthase II [Pseudomonadota bacterium]